MECPIYYSPLILEPPIFWRCLCFHSPIILGVPIFWAWSILWHSLILGGIYHAYYSIPYSLGASSYSYHSSPSHSLTHHHSKALAIIRQMDRQALPHVSHATSQPHSSMLSLPYPYAMPMVYPYPMPIPMVVPQPCTHHTRTHTQSHERATETHSEPWARHRHHH